MEIGSISDWLSSLSTFGTLVIAGMAYRKAPDWFESKHNEVRFEYAMSIRECFELSVSQLDKVLGLAEAAESIESMTEKYDAAYNQIISDILKLRQLLAGCSKYNLLPNQLLNEQALALLNFVSSLSNQYFNRTPPKKVKDRIDDYNYLRNKCQEVASLQIDVLFKFLDKKK
ncbi:TPA: hypothetical protein ACGD5E_004057 [Serratia marcescens]|nr:hypothetical protein [Serratia marcescens]